MKKILYYLIPAIICILVILGIFLCCNTFKPIWIKELPSECNMCLNTYEIYYKTADKSATVPPYDYCIKKLHRLSCQAEVFGVNKEGKPNPVDYEDLKKLSNYTRCLSELK